MEVGSRLHNLYVQDYLRGHKGQVLCVAARNSKAGDVLVATGAEDSTVRLWDLRNKSNEEALSWTVTSCLCRCFDGEPVASVVFSPDAGDRLYCSAGGKVVEFDLRGGRGELLVTTPDEVYQDDTEEVNELATHPKGEYLAAADDSGVVKVFNTRTKRLHKTLRNVHSNICHAVRFRPRSSWDIASGALDSTLAFWDFNSGRVRSKVNLAEGTVPATGSSHQNWPHFEVLRTSVMVPSFVRTFERKLRHKFTPAEARSISTVDMEIEANVELNVEVFNPPFVHSLDFASNGRHLAAGAGDGSVLVFDAKTRTPIGRCVGHIAPVSQVHYPCFNSDILISAGNDRRMFFWDHSVFEAPASSPGEKAPAKGVVDSKVGDRAPGIRNPKKSSKKARARGAKASHLGCTQQDGLDSLPNNEASTNGMPESDKFTTHENRRSSGLARKQAGDGDAVPALIEQSAPLLELPLEEKPNWVCSISVPYKAVLLADTSPVVKIMRWEGA